MSKKILVIKLGALGDFIYAFGAMKAIRAFHKGDHITLLTTKAFVDLAKQSRYFDDVIVDDRPKWANISGWFALRGQLNVGKFSRVYDLQNNDRTSFYKFLFHPQPEWAGTAWGSTFRNKDKTRVKRHAFYGLRDTLHLAGIKDVTLDDLSWMESDISRFGLPKNYALIIAGSAPTRLEKRWPVENFCDVSRYLLSQNITPVILGTESEAEMIKDLRSMTGVIDLTGKTKLSDIPALARGASVAIGNDTGPIHIAAVTGCKVIVLYNTKSSTVAKSGPQGPHVKTFESQSLNKISADDVIAAIKNYTV